MLKNSDDQVLIKKFLSGDNNSFEILLNRHKSKIFGYIMSKVKNSEVANDIFQDTFIKIINSLKRGRYNEVGKFLPWIFRIAHNLIIDHFRRQKNKNILLKRDNFDILDFVEDSSITIENSLIREEVYSDLKSLVELLPKSQKEVIHLRYFEEKSFKEIAKFCNISINTALGRMRYALINLRKLSEKKKLT